ncbi:hypothetical protein [Natrinema sp. 1APR25-10V2]|uniref:hypothetical protein n=1 Tax=Natrinema sp. 1APR25-10V2 TaxID=2951081 RepID=UPI002875F823|nr:hypothetical protein [Natrinema sp. 1APR25-10V2]MDS0476808.1 hypothetical protein [Natrinema sp. 1APR25-10V2]
MTENKQVSVTMPGSGKTQGVTVQPGDRPRDVLARTVDTDPDGYSLRSGSGTAFDPDTNVFKAVDDGDVLYGSSPMVVGTAGTCPSGVHRP